jgi:DNA-binding IclR family transcriptional regulator
MELTHVMRKLVKRTPSAVKAKRGKRRSSAPTKNGNRTPALKVLNALRWIVEEQSAEVGVREMAVGLRVSPSTAHRLLTELAKADFVQHHAITGRYSLSLEFLRLAHLTIGHLSLQRVAMTHMRRLPAACNETSLLGIYDATRQEMMVLAIVESSHQLQYKVDLNEWIPVHAGASGLAIVAFLGEDKIESIIARTGLRPLTPRSITERYKFDAELQKIRKRGYAITRGQRTPGAVGLGAPIFNSDGEVVGDICLTLPESRFDASSQDRMAGLLKACANEVTKAIGGQIMLPPVAQRGIFILDAESPAV